MVKLQSKSADYGSGYERKQSSSGKDALVLKAGSGQSRMFGNVGAMKRVISAVMSGVASAALDDQMG